MHIHTNTPSYVLILTDDERSALIWALEVGRAILLRDPGLYLLADDPTVSDTTLDALADRLTLASQDVRNDH